MAVTGKLDKVTLGQILKKEFEREVLKNLKKRRYL